MLVSLLLFSIVLEVLAIAVKQTKKSIQIGEESTAVTVCRYHDCVENPKVSTPNLLELMSEFSKVARCRINIQKSVAFLYTNRNISERENFKNPV